MELKKYLNEYLAALCGTTIILSSYATYAWTSPTLPKLLAKDSPLPITSSESSWIASMLVLGSMLGPLATVWMVDRYGRKFTLLFAAIPSVIGWILVIIAKTVIYLYIARLICGFSVGMAIAAMPMYLGEIASNTVRGSIGTLFTVMSTSGIIVTFSIGPYISFTQLAWVLFTLPIIFFALFIWLPESPYFYAIHENEEKGIKSLIWLRRHSNVKDEYDMISQSVKRAQANRGTAKQLFKVGNRLSLLIVLGLAACQQLTGSHAILVYSQLVFENFDGILGASEAAIVLAVVRLISALIASSTVDKIGRRPLLLFSTAGCAVCNTIVGLYFFLDTQTDIEVSNLGWIPISTIMIFMFIYAIGLATIPFVILSEIFPTNVKAIANTVFTMFASGVSFGVTKLFGVVNDSLGAHVTFWGFAIFSFSFVLFIWFLIPETKGKSLDNILEDMKLGRNKTKIQK